MADIVGNVLIDKDDTNISSFDEGSVVVVVETVRVRVVVVGTRSETYRKGVIPEGFLDLRDISIRLDYYKVLTLDITMTYT